MSIQVSRSDFMQQSHRVVLLCCITLEAIALRAKDLLNAVLDVGNAFVGFCA